MDLYAVTRRLQPVKGRRLAHWLGRFLIASPEQLSRWSGTFTEVTAAKVVEIYRKRGIIEEKEANQSEFSRLVNVCYRTPVMRREK